MPLKRSLFVVRKKGILLPSEEMKKIAWVSNSQIYKEADKNPIKFWEKQAAQIIWSKKWTKVYEEKLPYFRWFLNSKLNMSYNCIDRHLKNKASKIAIIWVPEPVEEKTQKITYKQLYENVCKTANVLKKLGIKKGDSVGIYMPMIPETFYVMLACTRVGAMHIVIFSAFSSEAAKTRLTDAGAKLLITADGYYRRGEFENLFERAREAVKETKVKKILIVQRNKKNKNNRLKLNKNEMLYNQIIKKVSSECKPVFLDSEATMFLLYTSGCCHGDSFVQLANGEITRIKDLVESNTKPNIINMHPDPFIQIQDKVTYLHKYPNQSILYKIRTPSFEAIFTPNHRLFSIDKNGNLLEQKIAQIRKNDKVFVISKINISGEKQMLPNLKLKENFRNKTTYRPENIPKISNFLTPEFAQILGYLTGDGHADKRSIIFTDKDKDNLIFYQNLIEKELNLRSIIRKIERQRLLVNSSPFTNYIKTFFSEFICKSRDRTVPKIIQKSDNLCVASFLRGLFDAEGTIGQSFIKLSVTSEQLVRVSQLLLRRFEIIADIYYSITPERNIQNRKLKETKFFNLIISDRASLEKYKEKINFSDKNKKFRFEKLMEKLSFKKIFSKDRFPIFSLLYELTNTIKVEWRKDFKKITKYVYTNRVTKDGLKIINNFIDNQIIKLNEIDFSNLNKTRRLLKIDYKGLSKICDKSQSYIYKILSNKIEKKKNRIEDYNFIRSFLTKKRDEKLSILKNIKKRVEKLIEIDGAMLEKVLEIGKINDSSEFVYDLTTERNHNYIINGFITHNTTGKPKGIRHTTGGYAVQALTTAKYNFNLKDDSVMWCTADIGWITGHTYACYGPLLNRATTLIYEGSPDFPDKSRFWKIIDENKVSAFYTAPTALRMFQAWGDKFLKGYKLDNLKILGTVGEPIDISTWNWYFKNIGKRKCPIIDTWWQTETGGTLINELPGIGPFIPSFAGKSFPGTKHAVVNENGEFVKKNEKGLLVQLSPFAPGMLRGIWGKEGDKKYKEKYWRFKNIYETGDGAFQNKQGEFRILGRTDDVMKVAGHRLSTAELENAIHKHKLVADNAVVSKPDKIKNEVPVVFAELKNMKDASDKLKQELTALVLKHIGPIAKPSEIYFVRELPKTRSGKIIRRMLKALLRGEEIGDTSTLLNPQSVDEIREVLKEEKVKATREKK